MSGHADLNDVKADARALFTVVERHSAATVRVMPTDYSRGPWDHGFLHAGPIAGLAAWAAEHCVVEQLVEASPGMVCSRLTVELLSAVPQATLEVTAVVAKPGNRSRVVDVTMTQEGVTMVRATSQWLRPTIGWEANDGGPPGRPDEVASPGSGEFDYSRPGFNCDAAELRYVSGSNEESGSGTIWIRLTSPVVAGEPTSPLGRVATVADLAAAVGWELGPHGASYINPDLTLQLSRYPAGPWIALAARNRRASHGVGYNDALLYDDEGSFGRVLQSLVETSITF